MFGSDSTQAEPAQQTSQTRHTRSGPTSIVVLPVAARCLHGRIAARSSPAQLADAVPAVHVQSASAVPIAQARASLCKANSHTFRHTTEGEKCSPEKGW